ncbi:hypothetical protein [Taibaiella chishuiensis]|uniref:Uncharacterized protein n=1 Tax=Taibaiella chishuiensis TaxID=1434707 RepID=A0A2P8D0U8_9BACT|nr:hypothetical protein [Taibaiella chishuiensis]PSK90827.1 hypothetical protein B0I18_107239 [Taibaiella chishuiensis]
MENFEVHLQDKVYKIKSINQGMETVFTTELNGKVIIFRSWEDTLKVQNYEDIDPALLDALAQKIDSHQM